MSLKPRGQGPYGSERPRQSSMERLERYKYRYRVLLIAVVLIIVIEVFTNIGIQELTVSVQIIGGDIPTVSSRGIVIKTISWSAGQFIVHEVSKFGEQNVPSITKGNYLISFTICPTTPVCTRDFTHTDYDAFTWTGSQFTEVLSTSTYVGARYLFFQIVNRDTGQIVSTLSVPYQS